MIHHLETNLVKPATNYQESWIMRNDVDCETLFKSLVFMSEGVSTTIGENGARAARRIAGHRAAFNLLEVLPLQIDVADALKRAGSVMAELGIVGDVTQLDERHLAIHGNAMLKIMQILGVELNRHPACYYSIGLFEGFVHVLSKAHVSIVHHEILDDAEIWTLAE